MCSSSKFSSVMTVISDFFYVFIITKIFFTYMTYFLLFIGLNFLFVNGIISFSSKLIISVPISFLSFQNFSIQTFLIQKNVFFVSSNEHTEHHAYPEGLCLAFSLCKNFQDYFDNVSFF